LVHQNIGYTALTTGELWANHPEKALGMRAAWVDKYPPPPRRSHGRDGSADVVRQNGEQPELAGFVARRQWFNVPAADIINRIKGDIDYGNGRVAKGTKPT